MNTELQENIDKLPMISLDELDYSKSGGKLCEECKPLGYCRMQTPSVRGKKEPYVMTKKTIAKLVPLQIHKQVGIFSQKHLQIACEAFHQQDFETAILNCKAVIEVNNYSFYAIKILCACYYFIKDYRTAIDFARRIDEEQELMMHFIAHCESELKDQNDGVTVGEIRANESDKELVFSTVHHY